MTKEYLQERMSKLIKERDEFVAQANRDIAFLNGRIAELESLIAPEAEPEPEPKDEK